MASPHSWPYSAGISPSPLLADHFKPSLDIRWLLSYYSSLSISVASTLLNNCLTYFVRSLAPTIEPSAALRAGALNLSSLTTSPEVLTALKQAWAKTIDRIMIFSLVLTCLGVPVACGMRWFNIKSMAASREEKKSHLQSGIRSSVRSHWASIGWSNLLATNVLKQLSNKKSNHAFYKELRNARLKKKLLCYGSGSLAGYTKER